MKKASVFTLFFFFFSVVQPPQARAVVLIDDAMIGAVLLTGIAVAGVHGAATYYEKTGENPITALVNGVDHIFQPAILAFRENFVSPESFPAAAAQYVGVEAAVGAKIRDLYDFVKNSASGAFTSLRSIFSSVETPPSFDLERNLVAGDTFKGTNGQTYVIGQYVHMGAAQFYPTAAQVPVPSVYNTAEVRWVDDSFPGSGAFTKYYQSGTRLYQYIVRKYAADPSRGWEGVQGYFNLTTTANPPLIDPEEDIDLPAAGQSIAASVDPQTKDDVVNALKQMPPAQVVTTGAVPANAQLDEAPPPAVTSADVNKFYSQNAVDVANQATVVASDPAATPADIASAQTAVNAAVQMSENAQTQAEPVPETYTEVPLSGFAEPYNPGAFDIPDRFDTFLANVAGTGLFSLPSQYFNSLPGGGSPVYTVEAGTYGTHTIDLSETMGTGLAVLKTVLLACFGFLCIRVVVLKR